jgi:beta-mannosidase
MIIFVIHRYDTSGNTSAYEEQYIQLYVDVIQSIVNAEDPTRSYLVSSPSNGIKSEEDGYIASDPYSSNYGDSSLSNLPIWLLFKFSLIIVVHHFNFVDDGWDPAVFPQTRFASAFGFHSYPSIRSLKTVAIYIDVSDGFTTDFTKHRQHHLNGHTQMRNQTFYRLLRKYEPPTWRWDDGLEVFTYFNQVC